MAREKHMDGIFNPLITRNFIRLWQPFSWRRWLALGLLGCPSRCALHGQLLLTPPFCRRILFTTAGWLVFLHGHQAEISRPCLLSAFLCLYLFHPLFFPLLSVGVGACEPTFCGWLQGAELMLSGAYMTITRLNAKTVPFPTPYYPIPGDMAW